MRYFDGRFIIMVIVCITALQKENIVNLIILFGGNSEESEVSLLSAKEIKKHTELNGHLAILIDLQGDYSDFDSIVDYKALYKNLGYKTIFKEDDMQKKEIGNGVLRVCHLADMVFLATHGGIGENGKLQAILDIETINYTGNRFLSTAISMDKELSKRIVKSYGGLTPKTFDSVDSIEDSHFPLIIKPNNGGSSIGIKICQSKADLNHTCQNQINADMIVEQFISGREFSVGVVGELALPPIEVIVEDGFYDYNKKYIPGLIKEIVPAKIDGSLSRELCRYALQIHQYIGLEVYSRSDFIVDERNNIFFIEINAIPGMTPTSLLPQEAKAVGIHFSDLCDQVLDLSSKL